MSRQFNSFIKDELQTELNLLKQQINDQKQKKLTKSIEREGIPQQRGMKHY